MWELEMGIRCKLQEQLRTTVRHCRAVVLNCSELPTSFPPQKCQQERYVSNVFSSPQFRVFSVFRGSKIGSPVDSCFGSTKPRLK